MNSTSAQPQQKADPTPASTAASPRPPMMPRPHDQELEAAAKEDVEEAVGWGKRAYAKFGNDWTMNLVSMVSYNVLTSVFPLLLALLTLLALVPAQSGHTADFANQMNKILPAEVARNLDIPSLLSRVRSTYGILTLISVVGLLWGGSNLFGAIENAFAVIYRVGTRDFLAQKLMSLVMILLFAILLPLSFVSSFALGAGTTTLGHVLPHALSGPLAVILGIATSLAALFVLFLIIYIVVPNIPLSWRHAWRGALVAAIAMALVNTVFPFYTAHFLGTSQYGAAAIGTVVVAITWFWFFSLVLLVGAQANSLAMHIPPWPYDLSRVLKDAKPVEAPKRKH